MPALLTRTSSRPGSSATPRANASTLAWSASNLAADLRALGDPQAAQELDEDTLDRRRRILGEDHPDTLLSARNLATD